MNQFVQVGDMITILRDGVCGARVHEGEVFKVRRVFNCEHGDVEVDCDMRWWFSNQDYEVITKAGPVEGVE